MSNKEKALVKQIAALPEDMQEKFLLMAQGAAMAVDRLDKQKEEKTDVKGEG